MPPKIQAPSPELTDFYVVGLGGSTSVSTQQSDAEAAFLRRELAYYRNLHKISSSVFLSLQIHTNSLLALLDDWDKMIQEAESNCSSWKLTPSRDASDSQ